MSYRLPLCVALLAACNAGWEIERLATGYHPDTAVSITWVAIAMTWMLLTALWIQIAENRRRQ